MQLDGARVLITGGAGLIGSHIADLLVKRDVREIIVLDSFVRGRRENLASALSSGRRLLSGGRGVRAPGLRVSGFCGGLRDGCP